MKDAKGRIWIKACSYYLLLEDIKSIHLKKAEDKFIIEIDYRDDDYIFDFKSIDKAKELIESITGKDEDLIIK